MRVIAVSYWSYPAVSEAKRPGCLCVQAVSQVQIHGMGRWLEV